MVRIELVADIAPLRLELHAGTGRGCSGGKCLLDRAHDVSCLLSHQAPHLPLEHHLGCHGVTHAATVNGPHIRGCGLVQPAPRELAQSLGGNNDGGDTTLRLDARVRRTADNPNENAWYVGAAATIVPTGVRPSRT